MAYFHNTGLCITVIRVTGYIFHSCFRWQLQVFSKDDTEGQDAHNDCTPLFYVDKSTAIGLDNLWDFDVDHEDDFWHPDEDDYGMFLGEGYR